MGSVAADDGKCTHSARQSDSAVANGSRPEILQEDMTWEPLQQLMQNATIVDQDLLDNAIIETNNLTHAFIEPDSHLGQNPWRLKSQTKMLYPSNCKVIDCLCLAAVLLRCKSKSAGPHRRASERRRRRQGRGWSPSLLPSLDSPRLRMMWHVARRCTVAGCRRCSNHEPQPASSMQGLGGHLGLTHCNCCRDTVCRNSYLYTLVSAGVS